VDATVDILTGAHILRVTRRGTCLDLETDKGRVIVGGRYAYTDLHCLGCGEERLVEVVETGSRQEAVCGVCGRNWKLS
jgi:hypothetical protein